MFLSGFRPPCWSSSGWAPAWCLRTKLYKSVFIASCWHNVKKLLLSRQKTTTKKSIPIGGNKCEVVRLKTRAHGIDVILLLARGNNSLGETELRFSKTRKRQNLPKERQRRKDRTESSLFIFDELLGATYPSKMFKMFIGSKVYPFP